MSGFDYNWGWGAFQSSFAFTDHPLINFNSDYMFLHLKPSVQIRATSAAWLDIGVVVNYDLGDVGTAGGTPDDQLTFAVFAGVRVGF
jgi:hypothetical protein